MASVRKILKRTLGGLKVGLAWTPIVLCVGGLAAAGGTGIAYAVVKPSLDEYKTSEIYQQEVINDLDKYQEAYENGELSQSDYVDKINAMDDEDYLNEVLARDIEGNEEWRGYLKSSKDAALGIAALSLLGTGILAGISLWPWFGLEAYDSLLWSADDDFDWEPPKKEPKPKKQPKIEIHEENAIKEDISEDEEVLGSTDDFINSLQ